MKRTDVNHSVLLVTSDDKVAQRYERIIYIHLFYYCFKEIIGKKFLYPFGYAGRMALTNYLRQTIIGVFIFTGLGIYGEINLGLVILIFLCFPI